MDTLNFQAPDIALFKPSGLPDTKAATTPGQARQLAEEFEAVFLSSLLAPIVGETTAEAPFGGGYAEETWKGLLVEEYAREISKSGGIGISEILMREILAIQEQGRSAEDTLIQEKGRPDA